MLSCAPTAPHASTLAPAPLFSPALLTSQHRQTLRVRARCADARTHCAVDWLCGSEKRGCGWAKRNEARREGEREGGREEGGEGERGGWRVKLERQEVLAEVRQSTVRASACVSPLTSP
eukprot:1838972-Rhodomonas_salina.1